MKQFISSTSFRAIMLGIIAFIHSIIAFACDQVTRPNFTNQDFYEVSGDPFDDNGDPFEDGDPFNEIGSPQFISVPSAIPVPNGDPYATGDPYGDPNEEGGPLKKIRQMIQKSKINKANTSALPSSINPNSPNYNPATASTVIHPTAAVSPAAAKALKTEAAIIRSQGMLLPNDQILLAELRGATLQTFDSPTTAYNSFPNLASFSARSVKGIVEYIKTYSPFAQVSVIGSVVGTDVVMNYTPGAGVVRNFAWVEFSFGQSPLNWVPSTTLNVDVSFYNRVSGTAVQTRLVMVVTAPRVAVKIWPWIIEKGLPLPVVGEATPTKPVSVTIVTPANPSTFSSNLLIPGPLNDSFIAFDKMLSRVS